MKVNFLYYPHKRHNILLNLKVDHAKKNMKHVIPQCLSSKGNFISQKNYSGK